MNQLVIGPPRSGKSLYAEAVIARCAGSTLYVGTLPHEETFRNTIAEHQARRPSNWGLVELRGNLPRDFCGLAREARQYDNILLDGALGHAYRYTLGFRHEPGELLAEWESLLDALSDRDGCLILVDPPVPQGIAAEYRRSLLALRRAAVGRADLIRYVEAGHVWTVSREVALRDACPNGLFAAWREELR